MRFLQSTARFGAILLGVHLLLVLVGCATMAAPACASPAPIDPWAHVGFSRSRAEQIAAAVQIDCGDGSGGWTGSGGLVMPGTVLTARHVAHCPDKLRVKRVIGDDWLPARLVWESEEWDLARVELAAGAHFDDVRPAAYASAVLGDRACVAAARPGGMYLCGPITRVGGSPIADIRAGFVMPGNSGSLMYDPGGRVLGVVTTYSDCGPDAADVHKHPVACDQGWASSVWNRAVVLP